MIKQPFTYEEFKKIYAQVPRLTVQLVINSSKGVLLTKRNIIPFMGAWHLPGTTMYHNETVETAVKRLAREELNTEVVIDKLLGYNENFSAQQETPFDHAVALVFLVKVLGDEPTPHSQSEEVGYFKIMPSSYVPEEKAFLEQHGLVKA